MIYLLNRLIIKLTWIYYCYRSKGNNLLTSVMRVHYDATITNGKD